VHSDLMSFEGPVQCNIMVNRDSASCGVIKRADGNEEIVVAGGFCRGWSDSVEIFSLSQSQWRTGEKEGRECQTRA
jgi:hypothetical protein